MPALALYYMDISNYGAESYGKDQYILIEQSARSSLKNSQKILIFHNSDDRVLNILQEHEMATWAACLNVDLTVNFSHY